MLDLLEGILSEFAEAQGRAPDWHHTALSDRRERRLAYLRAYASAWGADPNTRRRVRARRRERYRTEPEHRAKCHARAAKRHAARYLEPAYRERYLARKRAEYAARKQAARG